jgi:hypothetical protein
VGNLFRYLLAFAVQIAWQRAGRGGSIPPVRMPVGRGKGKTLPLPIIGPWQMMAAMWLARKIWARYGDDIQRRFDQEKGKVLDRLDHIVVGQSKSGNNPNGPASQSTPPAAPQIAAPAARPAPNYGTQVLDDSTSNSNSPSNLPPGSVLTGLRGTS